MKRVLLAGCCLGVCGLAGANYQPPSAAWKAWTIEVPCSPLGLNGRYPISNLLDGSPATAWVFGPDEKPKEFKRDKTAFSITFTPNKAVPMDAIQLMNGYNKSHAAFKRNNRALRVEVSGYDTESDQWHVFKASWLKDTMGWHTVKLPARSYGQITIVFSGIRKGRDNDLALSELRFLNGGRPVDWKLPRAAMMTWGSDECG